MSKSPFLDLHFTALHIRRLDKVVEIPSAPQGNDFEINYWLLLRIHEPMGTREEYFREINLMCRGE